MKAIRLQRADIDAHFSCSVAKYLAKWGMLGGRSKISVFDVITRHPPIRLSDADPFEYGGTESL
jgi:hypothetical protein